MTTREIHEIEAGEYVLGLMEDAERARFETRLEAEADLRTALREVRGRLHELDETAPVVKAPESLWAAIETRLDPNDAKVVPMRGRSKIRDSGAWDFWSGFAAAAIVALVAIGGLWTRVTPTEPRLIVVLLDAQSQPGAIVEAFSGDQVRVVPLARFDVPEGKVLEVWTLPGAATGPVSLGLLEGARATTLSGLDLPPPAPEQLYEITLVQAGGSPTGKPTGPIIAKGFARAPQI
jgi:anti-sigma-K factor RskA